LRLEGALAGDRWSGNLLALEIDATSIASLALVEPTRVAWSAPTREFEVARACLADGETRLCVEGSGRLDGALRAEYSVQELPLALAAAVAPTPLPVAIDGRLGGRGEVRRDARGRIEGEARLGVPRARIALADVEDAEGSQQLLDVTDFDVVAAFTGPEASAALTATLDGRGMLDGRLRVAGLDTADASIDGRLRAELPSLAVAGLFVPQLAGVDGRLRADLGVGGTLAQPRLDGELLASGMRADVPELGLELREGRLRLAPQPDGRVRVDGSIRSGDGELTLVGDVRASGEAQGRISGRDFLAADRPGARVVVAPDLELAGDRGKVEVSGRITVPAARIDLQRLPRGDRAPTASPDVVVIDDAEPASSAADAPLPVFANLQLALGEAVTLVGFGLDARVTGNLQLRERPGQVTTGAGEIRVAGVYQAYGQDLTIREGRLLYAGTPIDDPRLNLVAVRVVDEVTAGLRVTGSARAPQLEVFSDPPMGQAGALAYLVAGRPLEEIGQGDAEGDALESAARSLGTAAGGLLARSVGRRLGVDVLGIEKSEALGGAALTIGQYLSPRVFVSYGVGLFDPGEVVTLSYRLARSLTIEAESATRSSRVGVEYRAEK
jgi:translocation and assembly module TamB